jgi:hypothetical protein
MIITIVEIKINYAHIINNNNNRDNIIDLSEEQERAK